MLSMRFGQAVHFFLAKKETADDVQALSPQTGDQAGTAVLGGRTSTKAAGLRSLSVGAALDCAPARNLPQVRHSADTVPSAALSAFCGSTRTTARSSSDRL